MNTSVLFFQKLNLPSCSCLCMLTGSPTFEINDKHSFSLHFYATTMTLVNIIFNVLKEKKITL